MNLSKELFESEKARAARVFEQRGIHSDHLELLEHLKDDAATLHARMDRIAIPPGNQEAGRLVAMAKSQLEIAVMCAVKAISRFNASPNAPEQPSGDAKP